MASSPQHEPTMEEILASIRKIISEDTPEAAPAEPVQQAAPQPAPPATPAVESAPAPKTPEVVAKAADEDVLDLTEEVAEPAPKPADEVVFQTIEEPAHPESGSDIFSDKSRKALDDAFDKLDSVSEPAAPPAPAAMASAFKSTTIDGNSVEAVFERAVRDAVGPHIDQWMSNQKDQLLAAMSPLIREWMDEHFPAILEGAVRDEVARAVKARGKR